jgi:hypothetical protein
MRLESLIADLLYEHDCVVVPGFGGLVANYRSAKLNKQTHRIAPPSKHIGFNGHLKNNDGLLVAYLATMLECSYKDAQSRIESHVAEWQSMLQRDGRLFWERIGTFFFDKGGQLQFIPEEQENFLMSSFGLLPVQLTPVAIWQDETPVVEMQPIATEKNKPSIVWRVAAVAAIPLLAAGIWIAGSHANSKDFNFASLNPFHTEKIVSPYSTHDSPSVDETVEWKNVVSPLDEYLAQPEQQEPVRFNFEKMTFDESGVLIAKNIPAVADKTSKAPGKHTNDVKKGSMKGKFAIIGGAFADDQNAQRFLDKLQQDGFDASFAGKKGYLQLVAYGFYDSMQEAQTALANIRSSGTGGAWIKRY